MDTDPTGRRHPWLVELRLYDCVVYREGAPNGNADALSRLPQKAGPNEHYPTVDVVVCDRCVGAGRGLSLNNNVLGTEQTKYPYICWVPYAFPCEMPRLYPTERVGAVESFDCPKFCTYRHWEDAGRTWLQDVLTSQLSTTVLTELHDSPYDGHLGQENTIQKVQQRFYWCGMTLYVKRWCSPCITCAGTTNSNITLSQTTRNNPGRF